MSMDRHYTPANLAKRMLAKWSGSPPKLVADFSAGEGSLLLAAHEKWPDAAKLAVDIDRAAIRRIKSALPKARTSCCDFMNPNSTSRSVTLSNARGKVSLVLLNPPFSCRGSTKHFVNFRGSKVSASLPMAFLLSSLAYLHSGGEAVALLPSSCLTSEKDAEAVSLLARYYDVEVIGRANYRSFANCYVNVDVVALKPRSLPFVPQIVRASQSMRSEITIKRGTIPMHTIKLRKRGGIPLIHSTELKGGSISEFTRLVSVGRSTIHGPAVLLPRVGNPDVRKVCLHIGEAPIAISDCVIAICPPDWISVDELYHRVIGNWSRIQSEYVGSCAKYLTIKRLKSALSKIEIQDSLKRRRCADARFDVAAE